MLAESSKEARALSIFLSCLASVREFGAALLASMDQRVGARSSIDCYTEVVFKGSEAERDRRPDGLLVVTSSKRRWRAIIEAKIGSAQLDAPQLEAYLRLAKEQNLDAVITISNQFVLETGHHPVDLKRPRGKTPPLLHWSWAFILTKAVMLLDGEGVEDSDQRLLLREFVRFLRHPSTGLARFTSMNPEWKTLLDSVQAGKAYSKSSPEVRATVRAWSEECRDLALQLSCDIGSPVSIVLGRAHARDARAKLDADAGALAGSNILECQLNIPNAASRLNVVADVAKRSLTFSMSVRAPDQPKRPTSKIMWLLRQLRDIDPADLHVRCHWPGRARPTQLTLAEARERPEGLCDARAGMEPHLLEVLLVVDEPRRFRGRRTFIELIEQSAPSFYVRVGQNLRAWQPPAPKLRPGADLAASIEETDKPEPCGSGCEAPGPADPDAAPAPGIRKAA